MKQQDKAIELWKKLKYDINVSGIACEDGYDIDPYKLLDFLDELLNLIAILNWNSNEITERQKETS